MKKLFLLFAVLIVSACKVSNKEPETKKDGLSAAIDTQRKLISRMNSASNKLNRSISFLDSNLKYGHLADEMKYKMTRAEADYYRTGDEKYYKLFFRYQKKQWTYVGLCNRYADSLQANK